VDSGQQASGRPTDFAAWYAAEAPRAVITLNAALGDHGLAEECVAEAFARAYAQWPKVSKMDSANGWIYVVALNHARSTERSRRREQLRSGDIPAPPAIASPEPPDPIWDAVRDLAPQARRAIALRYIADLPEADIARAMGVTRGTVATTLHRARQALATRLGSPHKETTS
jgi:RNA polymerase sigma factor (sigma-70 family)